MALRFFPTTESDPDLVPVRSGLVFGFFNAINWQITIGTPMVLFAGELGASTFQVGLAFSFVFLLTPVQVFATLLLPRFGFKRVTLVGWGIRNFFLLVPLTILALVLASGPRSSMTTWLVGSVFWFCFFRAVGVSGLTPWLYAVIPDKARGRYFANDQFLSGIAGVGILLVSTLLFSVLPVFPALFVQYGIAALGAGLSWMALRRLPDVDKPDSIRLGDLQRDMPRHLFSPSLFRQFIWLAGGFAILTSAVPPFIAYYLKVSVGLGSGQIMGFEVLRYSGVIAAAWLMRRRIDATGAKPFFLIALLMYAVVACFWRGAIAWDLSVEWPIYLIYFTLGVGTACWTTAALNYLPRTVDPAQRTVMVAVFGAVTSFLGGLAPIVWGSFLKDEVAGEPSMSLAVFGWFFVFLFCGAVALSSLLSRLPEDSEVEVEPIVLGHAMFRPLRAATYLINLVDPKGGRRG